MARSAQPADEERQRQAALLARVFSDPQACELASDTGLQMAAIERRARRGGRWLVTLIVEGRAP